MSLSNKKDEKISNPAVKLREIGQKFDWTEMYWGGFDPEMIGAIQLTNCSTEESDNDPILIQIIEETKKKLISVINENETETKQIKIEDYFVTINEEILSDDIQQSNVNNNNSTNASTDVKQRAVQRNIAITIVRLWHKNVFIGVRGCGKADPGQNNFIARFHSNSAKLIDFLPWKT